MSTLEQAIERPSRLSPLKQRRLANFRANRRGWWSFWIFMVLFVVTLGAEFVANDRPILVMYKGELLVPAFVDYPESKFGGFLGVTNYRFEGNIAEIEANGWMLWPPVRFNHLTVDSYLAFPGANPPSWLLTREQICQRYPGGTADPLCVPGNYHWLGTDVGGRDVLARLIHGFRISILFGLILTVLLLRRTRSIRAAFPFVAAFGITYLTIGPLKIWADRAAPRFVPAERSNDG